MKCKFIVVSVLIHAGSETVEMAPVLAGSEENKTFSRYTPSGGFKVQITNPNLFGKFLPGQEYLFDITPAVV